METTNPVPDIATTPEGLTGERAELVETLRQHRAFLRHTAAGLDDEQASRRSTVSTLDVAGLIKHVANVEAEWIDFAQRGPEALAAAGADVDWTDPDLDVAALRWPEFHLLEGETLAGELARYEQVAAATEALIATADLDHAQPLPEAPWFPPGATWSLRRVLLHVLAETAQHAGHADVIREAIDGQQTM